MAKSRVLYTAVVYSLGELFILTGQKAMDAEEARSIYDEQFRAQHMRAPQKWYYVGRGQIGDNELGGSDHAQEQPVRH